MYNIANHYENIYTFLKTIITDPRVAYLHPFGSTHPENLEIIRDDDETTHQSSYRRGPLFIFYDQEPLNYVYNKDLFQYIKDNNHGPFILINTEKHSVEKQRICNDYGFAHLDYFFHIFAAADWFRGNEYIPNLIHPSKRHLKKTYITFNRLTSGERIYRSLFINELYKEQLLDAGHESFSKECPDGGEFAYNLTKCKKKKKLNSTLVEEAIDNISTLPELRIDFSDQHIPNQSMLLSPLPQLMESFIFVVTETCYWQDKTHLTEKIFKPIVLRMPFILVDCVNNLAYLRSYGFRTFGKFWDESYDAITDPIERMQAIVKILKDISNLSSQQQKDLLSEMQPILDHNYQLFNDPNFIQREWQHLTDSLEDICQYYKFVPPYKLDLKTGQAIPLA
jgi:hypothetical protein